MSTITIVRYSGIMFFVFYVSVLWAALRGVERGIWPPGEAKSVP